MKKEMMSNKEIIGYIDAYVEGMGWSIDPDPNDEFCRALSDDTYLSPRSVLPETSAIIDLILDSPRFKWHMREEAELLAEEFVSAHKNTMDWIKNREKEKQQVNHTNEWGDLIGGMTMAQKKKLKSLVKRTFGKSPWE